MSLERANKSATQSTKILSLLLRCRSVPDAGVLRSAAASHRQSGAQAAWRTRREVGRSNSGELNRKTRYRGDVIVDDIEKTKSDSVFCNPKGTRCAARRESGIIWSLNLYSWIGVMIPMWRSCRTDFQSFIFTILSERVFRFFIRSYSTDFFRYRWGWRGEWVSKFDLSVLRCH